MTRPIKLKSNEVNDFNETIEHKILMCTNAMGNNNKFYSIELQKSKDDKYQIFSHYGRINGNTISGGVYEKREYEKNESSAKRDFLKIINSKKSGKTKVKDGVKYREQYHEVSVISSNVGSSNIRDVTKIIKTNSLNSDIFKNFGKIEKEILIKLEEENVHDILSETSMTYNGGALQTPLGPLTIEHIKNAENILSRIADLISKKMSDSNDMKKLNNEYLSLIPRNMGNKIKEDKLVVDGEKLSKEYDLINQMKTAIDLSFKKDDDKDVDIGFTMTLAPKDVAKQIIDNFEKTRKHGNLRNYKIKNVFEIVNKKERENYEKQVEIFNEEKKKQKSKNKFDYQEIDLYHGSRNSNVLSILMNGFYVPPSNAKHVTGRMFGDGVYGADASTKALNYSAGYWGGKSNKYNNIFCFVTRFAMGKVYETQKSLKTGTPNGFNSIYAKGGYDLVNNEYIVPKKEQATITYLIELQ